MLEKARLRINGLADSLQRLGGSGRQDKDPLSVHLENNTGHIILNKIK